MKINTTNTILLVFLSIALTISCQFTKVKEASNSNFEKKEISNPDQSQHNSMLSDTLKLLCNNESLSLTPDQQKSIPYYLNNRNIFSCLKRTAYQGDKNSEKQLLLILQKISEQQKYIVFQREDRFRGWPIFDFFLELANDFECDDGGGAVTPFSISSIYMAPLKEMIKTIDGISYNEFVTQKQNAFEPDDHPALKDIENNEPCFSNSSRFRYDLLKRAIQENLVVLKAYGED